ncbi:MAG: hypothetical protein AAFU77_05100 [Myxococcota bacterium]
MTAANSPANIYRGFTPEQIASGNAEGFDYGQSPVLRRSNAPAGANAHPPGSEYYVSAGPVGPGYFISGAFRDPDVVSRRQVDGHLHCAAGQPALENPVHPGFCLRASSSAEHRAAAHAAAAHTWVSEDHDGRVSQRFPVSFP